MPDLPSDLSTKTATQIDNLIKTMIDYYNSNNNSFSGTEGSAYQAYIPTMVAQLQTMAGANPATNLQEMIQEDTKMDLQILEAKEDLKIAESRAASLRDMNKESYYQSWFPLNRPLRTSSNLIIMSIGIFFFILSFFIILRSAGVLVDINTTWISSDGVESPVLTKLRILFPFGYGTTVLFLGVIIIAIIGFLRAA
jgi:hypothetical protein